jgi:hypothetical protein
MVTKKSTSLKKVPANKIMAKKISTSFKKVPANKAKTMSLAIEVWEGCLAADAYTTFQVGAGQPYVVEAWIDDGCDSRGWSFDNWATSSGPKGVGEFNGLSLGYPIAPLGMLIGAITRIDAGASIDFVEQQYIFGRNVLPIGELYKATSPINGILYLIMNDTWSWDDNKGSIKIRVSLF